MINLCLVVIATQFSETKKRETERMWAERQRSSSSATLASVDQLGSCYDEILRYVAHLGRVARRRVLALWRRCVRRPRRRRRQRRRRQRRRRRRNTDHHVEAMAPGDDGGGSPRRLLRFDDQSASASPSHCRTHDVVRLNGFPAANAIANVATTTTTVNGQLASCRCSASVTDRMDETERQYFCSNTISSAHAGKLFARVVNSLCTPLHHCRQRRNKWKLQYLTLD